MNMREAFGAAKWVCRKNDDKADFSFLRSKFIINGAKKATLYAVGLGYFHCYINGKRVGDELFLPFNTDYEPRKDYPVGETVTGHRLYVPKYDITDLLKDGENVITLHFGGGWYTFDQVYYGKAKAIWRIFGESEDGIFDFCSSTDDKVARSFVTEYYFVTTEKQDFTEADDYSCLNDLDDGNWENAAEAPELDTEYLFSECPADKVCETLDIACLGKDGGSTLYDCGKNISGYPILKLSAKRGETVTVIFSEELLPDGGLDLEHGHNQRAVFVSDGEERLVSPKFTWFGFRYFSVSGGAEPISAEYIHTALEKTSGFNSDNEIINWINEAYINTQLCNLHSGIPSDCPHLERRGYTGDGQLTCHAVMDIFDAKEFYKKWIADIADCQDINTGHVQYTAPYTHSGGGPGGWGCAIIEVPYQYYLHYGDDEPLKQLYPQMLRYFDYLESHSYGKLVTSDKEGEWCLGDWCAPIQIILPAPFVNNYFYVKSLYRMIEISKLVGREADVPEFEKRIAERKEAIIACYYNDWDGNFIGDMQGANAFALDIGLGDERTYSLLKEHYSQLGRYDTGIFGTDIVTRVLFERGDGELAFKLLASESNISFDGMRKAGATTLWENWPDATRDRSRNHPMFGAVAAYFYDYFLGIRAVGDAAGYSDIVVSPVLVSGINKLSGFRTLPNGKVSVSYEKNNGFVEFCVTVAEKQKAVFVFNGEKHLLSGGENRFKMII